MTIIQGGRWEGWARRLFSLKGVQEPQSISSEVILTAPVVPVRPEDALLRGDKLYHGLATGAAITAEFAFVKIMNKSPTAIVTLEQIWTSDTNNQDFQLRLTNTTTGTGPVTIGGRDLRLGVVLTGKTQAAQITSGTVAGISGTLVQEVHQQSDITARFGCPVVCGPETGVVIYNTSANRAMTVTFLWREREAEPGELTL